MNREQQLATTTATHSQQVGVDVRETERGHSRHGMEHSVRELGRTVSTDV